MKYDFKKDWKERSIWGELTYGWLTRFVHHCRDKPVLPEHVHYLSPEEEAKLLHDKRCIAMKSRGTGIKQTVWKLTI